jgi:lambda repressor-like predicted transcriptional regulator
MKTKPLRDAAPIRMYLMYLRSEGMSVERIAEQSGVPYNTLRRIISGYWSSKAKKHVQAEKITDWNAQAILNTSPKVYIQTDKFISTRGSRRRLEALACNGWSLARLSPIIGMKRQNLSALMKETRTTTQTHQKIASVYDRIWNVAPEELYKGELDRAKTWARRSGFLPAMSWDDIDNDHDIVEDEDVAPDFVDWVVVENAVRGEKPKLTPNEQLAVLKVMATRGFSDHAIADALSLSVSATASRRRKHRIVSNWVSEGGPGRPQSTKMVA